MSSALEERFLKHRGLTTIETTTLRVEKGSVASRCHENVANYVKSVNPHAQQVKGWKLIIARNGDLAAEYHSVVRENGELIDITPSPVLATGFAAEALNIPDPCGVNDLRVPTWLLDHQDGNFKKLCSIPRNPGLEHAPRDLHILPPDAEFYLLRWSGRKWNFAITDGKGEILKAGIEAVERLQRYQ